MRRTRLLQGPIAAGSVGNMDERPPEAAPLDRQTCRPHARGVVRPLHGAVGDIRTPRAATSLPFKQENTGLRWSPLRKAKLTSKRRKQNQRKAVNSTTQSCPACWASSSNLARTCHPSRSRLACRCLRPFTLIEYDNALRNAAKRARLRMLKISPHCARHGGASTASFRLLLYLAGIQKRGWWLAANSMRRH